MIKLYDKTYTTEYGSFDTLAEAFIEEERNGLFELSFIILNTDSLFNYIKEENIVIVNANDTLLNQKFRIYMTRKLMNNRVEVFARHISFDLMYDYIDDVSFENQSCEYALNQLFRNSNFSKHYKGYSDIVNAQDYSMSMANVLEAIGGKQGSIIDTFGTGAELLRDNENIHVLNRRGNDNGVTIEYRKNLTGFELEEDTTDLVTKILPYAKYNDENNGEVIVKADYVDSPLIGNYSHPYIASIDYSDKFKDDEIPTVSKLQELARKEYRDNKVDIPKQNFKIEFIPLSKCVGYEGLEDKISLCDTVTIIDTRYNVNTKAKVIKTVFNVLKNRYESMELGEPRTSLGDIIGNGGDNEPIVGPPGPQGIQGPPGQNGSVEDFPDTLPPTPIVTTSVYGFANIEVSWTFENKVYYSYELYGSKTKDFKPNTFDLIFEGQASTYMFQAKPNETWYFRVCAINTHGERTEFSNQVTVTTTKIEDLSNYVENMAIGEALIGTLSLDRGWIGKLNANLLDVKGNFSVTDGNGLRTLDIDSFGNVHIKASSFSLQGKNIATEEDIRKTVKSVDVMYYLSTSQTSLAGGTWTTTAPTWVNGKYMWSKTVTKYTDNTISESAPTCIAGAKGDTGLDGVGVSEIIEEYYLSNSNTSQTGGTWTTSVPTWSKGKFIWTRSKIIYTNSQIDYTTPICDSTWQAIDQQTQIDIFNKLTNNGAMQGIYMVNNQLYINGQYINARNLSVNNASGYNTFSIDSNGNVSFSPKFMRVYTDDKIELISNNGNKNMLLYGGQVCVYNNANDTFMSTIGSVLKAADKSYKGVGLLLGKNANIFTIARDINWNDILTDRSPNPMHYITFNFDTNQADIDMELNTNSINMRGNALRNSSALGTNKLQTNKWYDLGNNPLFAVNDYWQHVDMYRDLEANYNAILNVRLVNPQTSYALVSGRNVDVNNDADILIANEDISTVDAKGNVSYDLNEMIKLLYSKIHMQENIINELQKEIKNLKGGVINA
ncbi:phage tail spike protein [Romboutsia ilealis]|uniref:phage tail spike protein n=1 Tax=Romboutsia ilealis TaxID=1115758 RepID=UPI0023F0AFDE|nr:phage tail spike protein [Romboutsia ilealis]